MNKNVKIDNIIINFHVFVHFEVTHIQMIDYVQCAQEGEKRKKGQLIVCCVKCFKMYR